MLMMVSLFRPFYLATLQINPRFVHTISSQISDYSQILIKKLDLLGPPNERVFIHPTDVRFLRPAHRH